MANRGAHQIKTRAAAVGSRNRTASKRVHPSNSRTNRSRSSGAGNSSHSSGAGNSSNHSEVGNSSNHSSGVGNNSSPSGVGSSPPEGRNNP